MNLYICLERAWYPNLQGSKELSCIVNYSKPFQVSHDFPMYYIAEITWSKGLCSMCIYIYIYIELDIWSNFSPTPTGFFRSGVPFEDNYFFMASRFKMSNLVGVAIMNLSLKGYISHCPHSNLGALGCSESIPRYFLIWESFFYRYYVPIWFLKSHPT